MSPKVGANPYVFRVGSKMSLYSGWNNYTKQDEGYSVGEELPMFYNGRVVGHIRVIEQHRKMFSNSYYWTAVRID
jgi:hypothetical protein